MRSPCSLDFDLLLGYQIDPNCYANYFADGRAFICEFLS